MNRFPDLTPVARYRVIAEDDGFRFLGKGKFRGIAWAHLAIFALIVVYMVKNAPLDTGR